MKLEIKHLAPYLPYSLKLQYVVREKVEKNGIMTSIVHNKNETHPTKVSIDWYNEEHIWMFKPILRPLSDLTKEIEHNGEKFVPIDNFIFKTSVEDFTEFPEQKHNLIPTLKYMDVQLLLEWHFDVFGLIENNLAIDKNTIL